MGPFQSLIFNNGYPLFFCGWLKESKNTYFINLTLSAISWMLGHGVFVVVLVVVVVVIIVLILAVEGKMLYIIKNKRNKTLLSICKIV